MKKPGNIIAEQAQSVPLSARLFQPATGAPASMNKKTCKILSAICFQLGILSILLSIGSWWFTLGDDPDQSAHAERFGIFIGLWAPTMLILSGRFDRFADKASELPGAHPELHEGTDDDD